MKGPTLMSGALLAISLAFLVAASSFRLIVPLPRTVGADRLEELRSEQARLGGYSDAAAREARAKLDETRRGLWNVETFATWRAEHLPEGWLVQELSAETLSQVKVRRYAFQKPAATARDWPQILDLLAALERAPDTSVQSAALTVKPGYAGSRDFSQCLFITAFYFAKPVATATP